MYGLQFINVHVKVCASCSCDTLSISIWRSGSKETVLEILLLTWITVLLAQKMTTRWRGRQLLMLHQPIFPFKQAIMVKDFGLARAEATWSYKWAWSTRHGVLNDMCCHGFCWSGEEAWRLDLADNVLILGQTLDQWAEVDEYLICSPVLVRSHGWKLWVHQLLRFAFDLFPLNTAYRLEQAAKQIVIRQSWRSTRWDVTFGCVSRNLLEHVLPSHNSIPGPQLRSTLRGQSMHSGSGVRQIWCVHWASPYLAYAYNVGLSISCVKRQGRWQQYSVLGGIKMSHSYMGNSFHGLRRGFILISYPLDLGTVYRDVSPDLGLCWWGLRRGNFKTAQARRRHCLCVARGPM